MNWNWPKLEVHCPENEAHYSALKTLFLQYAGSLNFDLEFQGFNQEMENFPGKYAPPEGCLLLAREDEDIVGCVALCMLETGICEMKRLYVIPEAQGRGIGRALVHRVIREAKAIGYKRMRLDTVPSMRSARRLYLAFGFRAIDSYRDNPVEGTTFMELMLTE